MKTGKIEVPFRKAVEMVVADLTEKQGWDKIEGPMFCYDFPDIVIHRVADCPRETGGVCHALPAPTHPPFTDDEKAAVYSYFTFKAGRFHTEPRESPTGTTVVEREVYE